MKLRACFPCFVAGLGLDQSQRCIFSLENFNDHTTKFINIGSLLSREVNQIFSRVDCGNYIEKGRKVIYMLSKTCNDDSVYHVSGDVV